MRNGLITRRQITVILAEDNDAPIFDAAISGEHDVCVIECFDGENAPSMEAAHAGTIDVLVTDYDRGRGRLTGVFR